MTELEKGLSVQRDFVSSAQSNGSKTLLRVDGKDIVVNRPYEVVMNHIHSPEIDVMEAASVLVGLLDQAAPHLHRLSEIGHAAGVPYEGPQFKDELEDLRIALEQAK